jgi:hypothetical protein
MQRLVIVLGVTVLLLSAWPAGACGDKLLVLGRGAHDFVLCESQRAWF